MAKTIDQEIIAAFERGGEFSWRKWWGDGFQEFKQLLKEQNAVFYGDTIRSGTCIDCGARGIGVYCLNVHLRNEGRHVILDSRFRDRCCR